MLNEKLFNNNNGNKYINLAKRLIIDNIYRSAKLEGINCTFLQTSQVLNNQKSDLRPNEILVILSLRDAWNYMFNNIKKNVDLELLKIYHSIIGKSCEINYRDIGNFRKESVYISGTAWRPEIPSEENVFNKINEIVSKNVYVSECAKDHTDIFRGIELFLYLCREQCFMDGNKRVATLFTNHYLIQKKVGIFSINESIQAEAKMKLIDWYENCENDDIIYWFYDNCIIK